MLSWSASVNSAPFAFRNDWQRKSCSVFLDDKNASYPKASTSPVEGTETEYGFSKSTAVWLASP